ncbi:hypothetical protein [Gordonia hongkongensis]
MNQAVTAGFVWQILLLGGLVYWSRFGAAAVIDAARSGGALAAAP